MDIYALILNLSRRLRCKKGQAFWIPAVKTPCCLKMNAQLINGINVVNFKINGKLLNNGLKIIQLGKVSQS